MALHWLKMFLCKKLKTIKWILVRVEVHAVYYKTPANQVSSFKLPG